MCGSAELLLTQVLPTPDISLAVRAFGLFSRAVITAEGVITLGRFPECFGERSMVDWRVFLGISEESIGDS